MPPQQSHRLLDLFDQTDRFRAHVLFRGPPWRRLLESCVTGGFNVAEAPAQPGGQ
jgi:hypothetical protein